MKPPRLSRLATLLLAALIAGGAAAAPLDDMRRLVDSSQFEQAVMLAQRHPELIGDVHFDFLYGVAAVSAGRVPEGLLALERHLAAVPANDRARLELARGYFMIGEYARARSEFEFVLRYNPTPGTRRTIETFLNAMQLRGTEMQGSARLYVDAGIGYDTNVNLGSRLDELVLESGIEPIVGTPAQAVSDRFAIVGVGAQHQVRVSPRFSVFFGGDLDQRVNASHREFDLGSIALNAGFTQLRGQALYRFTLGVGELRVGGERYRDSLSVAGEATWSFGPGRYLNGSAQYAEYRHAAAESQRDARAVTLALTWSDNWPRVFGAPQAGLRVAWTGETNTRLRDDLSRDVLLTRLYGALAPTQKLRLTGSLTLYGTRYRAKDFGFDSTREDTALNLDLLATYAIDPRWSLRAEWLSAWTRSNQDLYDSDRHSLALKTRYQY
jgi:tetratricopeptide (TPR) repeat protein